MGPFEPAPSPVETRSWPRGVSQLDAVLFAIVCLVATSGRMSLEPYDDAYFFKRFALNLLRHGVLAWNPADGPVYGNTSQLFQWLTVPIALLTEAHWVVAVRVVLALCLWGCAFTVVRAVRSTGVASPAWLLLASPVAIATIFSGMETALCLLLCGWFLRQLALGPSPARDAGLVALAWLAFLARPDTLLLTSLSWVVVRGRQGSVRSLLWLGLGVGTALLACRVYYGTALPLSFFLKSGASALYDPAFVAISRVSKFHNLAWLALISAPFLFIVAHGGERRSAALLLPAAAFVAFHALTTVEVMGMHARFYVPALPWLACVATRAYPRYLERARPAPVACALLLLALGALAAHRFGWAPTQHGWPIGRLAPAAHVAWIAAASVLLWPVGIDARARTGLSLGVMCLGLVLAYPPRMRAWPSDDDYLRRSQRAVTSYAGLDRLVRCLGSRVRVYHSEVGLLGLRLREAHITDLGGLMTPELTLGKRTFDAMCKRDTPDAIFLPHRNYRGLNASIRSGQCLRGYTRVTTRSSSPLFIRNDRVQAYRCSHR